MPVERQEFTLFQQRVEAHMAECNLRSKTFEEQFKEGQACFAEIRNQHRVTDEKLDTLINRTSGMVRLNEDLNGTIRLASSIRNAVLMLFKLGGTFAIIALGLQWCIDRFQEIFK